MFDWRSIIWIFAHFSLTDSQAPPPKVHRVCRAVNSLFAPNKMFYWDGHGALPAKSRPRERYRQSTLTRSPQLKSSAAPPASKVGGAAKTPPDRPIARRRLCPFHRFACIEAPFAWRVLSTRIIWRRKKNPKSVFSDIYINIYMYTQTLLFM